MRFFTRFARLGQFRTRGQRRQRSMRPSRPSPFFQPRLEALEDRVVPASLSYSTLLDGTVLASAIDSSGDIYVTGQAGSNLPTTPGAFQTAGSGAFVAKLNPAGTAVLYATYLGNDTSGNAAGSGIAIDSTGDAYIIGVSTNAPTTPNAIASAPSGSSYSGKDVFVAELNPTGSDLLYGTYIPGAVGYPGTFDYSGAIAVDGSGNIDVAGTAEAGLPVTANAFQTALGGSGNNAFFVKIDPALSGTTSVLYASYLGGSVNDVGTSGTYDAAGAIAVDGSGNVYLYGTTDSKNFPTTSGAFQKSLSGLTDAFVAKFNPAQSGAASLVFSTYLGGSSSDGSVPDDPVPLNSYINYTNPSGGIAVDSAGNVYVTGGTKSTNFPTTPGAYQTTSKIVSSSYNENPPSDIFVTKLNATGSALVYSTYLGGGSNPYQVKSKKVNVGTISGGSDIVVDADGDAYVTGWTNSTSFPTVNPLQATNNAGTMKGYEGMSAFVTTLNPSGSGLLFSTYLGGSDNVYGSLDIVGGFSIAVDSANNVYIAGQVQPATSSTFPTTPGAYDTTSGSGFVAKIDPPVEDGPVMPAIASTPSGAAPSSGQASANTGIPQGQNKTAQPASSQADPLFTLVGNTPGTNATSAALSGILSEWQSLESALLERFDSLLSLEAGAMGMSGDTLIRDLLFASEFSPSST